MKNKLKDFFGEGGFAILVAKYYDKYKNNAFVNSFESSKDSAIYTCQSLMRCDGIGYVAVDLETKKRVY